MSVDIGTAKMELTCPACLGDVDHVEDDDLATGCVLCQTVRRLPKSCTVLSSELFVLVWMHMGSAGKR
jgi:hypothetical protein